MFYIFRQKYRQLTTFLSMIFTGLPEQPVGRPELFLALSRLDISEACSFPLHPCLQIPSHCSLQMI